MSTTYRQSSVFLKKFIVVCSVISVTETKTETSYKSFTVTRTQTETKYGTDTTQKLKQNFKNYIETHTETSFETEITRIVKKNYTWLILLTFLHKHHLC